MEKKSKRNKPFIKVIMDQTNKQRPFQHSMVLRFFMKNGMKITKPYTVYQFAQSPRLSENIK